VTRRLAADVEIFHDGQVGKDAAVLRRVAEAAPRDLERLQVRNIAAVETHPALPLDDKAHDRF
jgi:hypothetical protein